MRKHGFIDFNVDTSTPFRCITPIDSFNHVEFREDLLTITPKHSSHLELLRQLALEIINDIPDQPLIIYTVVVVHIRVEQGEVFLVTLLGTMLKSAPGILTTVPSLDRNSLLLVALSIMLFNLYDSIWILTDSRSFIQYLKNWPKIMDSSGLDILSKLIRLGLRKQVCLQWISSHVGVPGNKAADELAGRECDPLTPVPLS
ncbi:RNase H domain-containing protein [Trichonephila clavipes]|nr:RNase H domain-containing protein [Trichonephila clavipes]